MSQVCTISVYVNDLKKAATFYSEVLGLKVAKELPYLIVLQHEGMDVVLCQAEHAAEVDYPNGCAVVLGFKTRNLDGDIKDLQSKGVTLIHSTPQDFPGGKFIAFRDPSGNVHELLEFQE